MATTNIVIPMDTELKEKAEMLFREVGLNMATALHKYVEKCVNDGKIPTKEMDDDPDYEDELFYSPSSIAAIMEGIKSLEEGRYIDMTMEELRSYDSL